MWSIMCIFRPTLLEQIFSIIRENWSFIMDCRPQQAIAVETFFKKSVLNAIFLEGKQSLLPKVICQQAFNLSSSFWEGAQHPQAPLVTGSWRLNSTSLYSKEVFWPQNPLGTPEIISLDTNSAQVFCTILKREQLERHSHFFY